MTVLTLTEEQARVVLASREPVQVCDAAGRILGSFTPQTPPVTAEEIAEIKRRLATSGVRFTGAQVQARLKALQEEWDRTGGFDEAYLRAFLQRLDAADPGHVRPRDRAG
jgi:uncharacterized protein YmfQ (DUF2313 family)